MTVQELIIKLLHYNQYAEVAPLAHNKKQEFSISYGGSDGCDKSNCKEVFIDCDDLNQHEAG